MEESCSASRAKIDETAKIDLRLTCTKKKFRACKIGTVSEGCKMALPSWRRYPLLLEEDRPLQEPKEMHKGWVPAAYQLQLHWKTPLSMMDHS